MTTPRAFSFALLVTTLLLAGCASRSQDGPTEGDGVEPVGADPFAFDGLGNLRPMPAAFLAAPPSGVVRPLPQAAREPTIGVAPDGTVYVGVWDQEQLIGSTGQPVDDEAIGTVLAVYASQDQGATWRNVKPRTPALIQVPPTTSDAFMEVDPVTGRVFTNDWTYACSTMSISDDQGASWTYSPFGCGAMGGPIDHQSITTGVPRSSEPIGYSRMVYYCVASLCSASLNGGLTFGRESCASGGLPVISQCGPGHGHVKTDAEGRVLLGMKIDGLPWLSVSEDDAATWRMTQINSTHSVYWHDVEMAADSAGTYYAAWQAYDGFPYLAVSHDLGATWGAAMRLAPPGLTATGYLMVVAGGPGKVAAVFLGTDWPMAYVEGMHPSAHRADMRGARMNAYLTMSLDADGADPTFVSIPLNDPADPMAADACWPGYRDCEDVGEFIDIVIGPDGRPWASLFDSCLDVCHATGRNEPLHGFRGAVGTLVTGPSFGEDDGALAPLEYVARWKEMTGDS